MSGLYDYSVDTEESVPTGDSDSDSAIEPVTCPWDCTPDLLGNGTCDAACHWAACGYDGGDCAVDPACPAACVARGGDGWCDPACNAAACAYDGGDCAGDAECTPGCAAARLGDGVCEFECDVEVCGYDGGDCRCPASCTEEMLGNGVCDLDCAVATCGYDAGECLATGACPLQCIDRGRDDACDLGCAVPQCDYDRGACAEQICVPGCGTEMLADGVCQPVCNTAACFFDFGDCSACQVRSRGDCLLCTQCAEETECRAEKERCEQTTGCPFIVNCVERCAMENGGNTDCFNGCFLGNGGGGAITEAASTAAGQLLVCTVCRVCPEACSALSGGACTDSSGSAVSDSAP